jgi:hypothetical protein
MPESGVAAEESRRKEPSDCCYGAIGVKSAVQGGTDAHPTIFAKGIRLFHIADSERLLENARFFGGMDLHLRWESVYFTN